MYTEMRINYIFAIMLCELLAVGLGNLPPEIAKCKSKDNDECVRTALQDIFQRYPTGNRELGMTNISAINLTNLKVSKSKSNSPIQINFEFIKCTMYGNEKTKFLKASGFDKEMKNPQIEVLAPSIKLRGDYEMTGKLLLFPINGKGIGEIDLRETSLKYGGKISKEMRDNQTYFKVNKLWMQIEPKQLFVNLENVFNGSPVLSKTINEVINENWKDIWSELKEGINRAIETVYTDMINAIFENLPIEDMYLD